MLQERCASHIDGLSGFLNVGVAISHNIKTVESE